MRNQLMRRCSTRWKPSGMYHAGDDEVEPQLHNCPSILVINAYMGTGSGVASLESTEWASSVTKVNTCTGREVSCTEVLIRKIQGLQIRRCLYSEVWDPWSWSFVSEVVPYMECLCTRQAVKQFVEPRDGHALRLWSLGNWNRQVHVYTDIYIK